MANSKVGFDLELAIKDFDKNLKSVDKNLKSFHNDFKARTKTSSQAWNSFIGNLGAKAVASATAAIGSLIVSMKELGKETFLAAVDAQETASKFEAVFSDITGASEAMAKDLQTNFGLGVTESKTLLSATGDLLTGFGFTQEGALELSNSVQELSVDLSSFTNFSGGAAGASEALTKALLGETEGLKALGISVNQKAIGDQVAINNAKGLTFETEQQAKAQATLDLVIKQSGNAIGDYAKTSGGAANTLKLLNTRIEDLKISIGNKLIPVIQPLVQKMITWIEANDDFIAQKVEEGVKTLTEAFTFLKDNLDTMISVAKNALIAIAALQVASSAATAINILSTSLVGLKAALVVLTGPIGLVVAGLTALGGAVALALSQGKDSVAIEKINQLKVATADLAQLEMDLQQAREQGSSERITGAIQARIDARRAEIAEIQRMDKVKTKADQNEVIREDKKVKNKAVVDKKATKDAKKLQDNKNKEALKQSDFLEGLFGKQVSWEKSGGKERAQNLKSTLSTMATLSESGNKTLAAIGKAAAVSTATIDGIAAVQKAMASAPPPLNFVLAGIVGTATALNVAKIAGVKMQHGGIVPGSSFAGDSVQANLNSGEMVLNRGQQTMLFQQANGGGTGGTGVVDAINALGERIAQMEIVMVADNTEIARSTSRGVESGIVIGRS